MGEITYFNWKCPECGEDGGCCDEPKLYKFCPFCGAKVEITNIERDE